MDFAKLSYFAGELVNFRQLGSAKAKKQPSRNQPSFLSFFLFLLSFPFLVLSFPQKNNKSPRYLPTTNPFHNNLKKTFY
jgi:hypothetical protein